ncbi:hypothetical protein [Burkholderia ubonensis]|uniref:hypothetical protein n=1 Tax=Burkholderia ubonensis TaxID=101571 RepID=UPI0012FA900A|nr:hypothetical protein [Burkholderia ubonensis]
MDDFLQYLHSPSWWLSVVAVGIVLSIIAAYITRVLDRVFGFALRKWADRSEQAKRTFANKVAVLRQSADARTAYFRDEVRYRHTAIYGAITATFLLGLLAGVSALESHRLAALGAAARVQVRDVAALIYAFYAISACVAALMSTTAFSKAQSMARHLRAAEAHLLP